LGIFWYRLGINVFVLRFATNEKDMLQQTQRMEFSVGQGKGHLDKLGDLWCIVMHTSPMWPIHGQYECGVCGRHFPVPWDSAGSAQVSH
jgi:hypothetical protein